MSTSQKPKVTARVEYYDSAWGGWRALTAFGDAPRDTWSQAVARHKAKELSKGTSVAYRAVSEPREGEPQAIAMYRRGFRVS